MARVGDDVYAGKDGNVYKRNGDGQLGPARRGGGWDRVQDHERTGSLDAQQRARATGGTRTQGYDPRAAAATARATAAAAAMRGGGGGRRR